MNGGEISSNTGSNSGGVYVYTLSGLSSTVTFTKTGGTINGNTVYATGNGVTKRKETTAGPGVNLYFHGGTDSSVYSGEWDY